MLGALFPRCDPALMRTATAQHRPSISGSGGPDSRCAEAPAEPGRGAGGGRAVRGGHGLAKRGGDGGRFGSLFFPHATEKIKLCNYDGTVPELNGSNDLPGPFVLFWDKERGEMRKNNY